VVVASHGRGDERSVLAAAVRARVPYVGLIASRRRGSAVLAELDVPDEQRARIHTPAGLDIGARTAAEIALSVYAEIIAERPGAMNASFSAAGAANDPFIAPDACHEHE
jgi:xanthine dehydrogenase accessory factor